GAEAGGVDGQVVTGGRGAAVDLQQAAVLRVRADRHAVRRIVEDQEPDIGHVRERGVGDVGGTDDVDVAVDLRAGAAPDGRRVVELRARDVEIVGDGQAARAQQRER